MAGCLLTLARRRLCSHPLDCSRWELPTTLPRFGGVSVRTFLPDIRCRGDYSICLDKYPGSIKPPYLSQNFKLLSFSILVHFWVFVKRKSDPGRVARAARIALNDDNYSCSISVVIARRMPWTEARSVDMVSDIFTRSSSSARKMGMITL